MKFWYQPQLTFGAALLYPLSRLYRKLAYRSYARGMKFASCNPQAKALQVPVIVVGNITVGGTGKTPMVRFLISYLNSMGFKVGVVSRGYGGSYKGVHHLQAGDSAELVGDEMAMQFAYCQRQNLHVEFVVCRERIQAALKCQELGVDFIISDDGLQHYALPRHIEIALIGPQALGNRQFIPAGPLREDVTRLRRVDFIINNSPQREWGGYKMTHNSFALVPVHAIAQQPEQLLAVSQLNNANELEQHLVLNWIALLSLAQPAQLLPQLYHWQEQLGWNAPTIQELTTLAQQLLAELGVTPSSKNSETMQSLQESTPTSAQNAAPATTTSQVIFNAEQWHTTLAQVCQSKLLHFMHEHASELRLEQLLNASAASVLQAPSPADTSLALTHGHYLPSLRLYQDTFAAINSTFTQRVQVESTQEVSQNHNSNSQGSNQATTDITFQESVFSTGNPLPQDTQLQVNSTEFQQFLNKQFCLETTSYQDFITKSLTRLSPIHILPQLFKATYPRVVALSAIGYPQGFTQTLQTMGFEVVGELVFGDHHSFTQADLDQIYTQHPEYQGLPLMCTEKDAIKLQHLAIPAPTFFVEREGLFLEHPRWLDQLKEKIVTIYNSSKY